MIWKNYGYDARPSLLKYATIFVLILAALFFTASIVSMGVIAN